MAQLRAHLEAQVPNAMFTTLWLQVIHPCCVRLYAVYYCKEEVYLVRAPLDLTRSPS